MSSSKLLTGKTVLLTGANRGIGAVMLELFASHGACVYACARKDSEDFRASITAISRKHSVNITPLFFDLSNQAEIKNTLKVLFEEKADIDVLVNNAGVAHGAFLHMTPIQTIRDIFEINFYSQLVIIQIISKIMMKNKTGSIINMGSIAGLDAFPGYSAYGSSKAALMHATTILSKELAPYNIRVNAIAPGLTNTHMAGQMETKAMDKMITGSAMNRMAEPAEIANTALFLASDLSRFINGQIIRVDGGF